MDFHLRVRLISPRIAISQDMHRREDGGDGKKNPGDKMLDSNTDVCLTKRQENLMRTTRKLRRP